MNITWPYEWTCVDHGDPFLEVIVQMDDAMDDAWTMENQPVLDWIAAEQLIYEIHTLQRWCNDGR
jgi:hypothetical protein